MLLLFFFLLSTTPTMPTISSSFVDVAVCRVQIMCGIRTEAVEVVLQSLLICRWGHWEQSVQHFALGRAYVTKYFCLLQRLLTIR